ncbi:MAG: GAF domain-containing protein, partial [Actinomycetota bacterium]
MSPRTMVPFAGTGRISGRLFGASLRRANVERDEIHELLDELARILIATESLDSTLLTVSHMTTRALEGCDAAGVTLLESDRSVKSTACTDPLVETVDRAQYETGEGPCVQALDEDRVIRTGHADEDHRWPRFGELAVRHGIKSVLAFPLEAGEGSIGALNCYGKGEDAFTEADERVGTLLASQAAVLLANVAAYD